MSPCGWMIPICLVLSGLLPALAQAPETPDAAFFAQDPKVLMRLCADEALRLKARDSHLVAEYGDTMLALGDRKKAEEAFSRALERKPNDPQTRRLIALAWLRHGFLPEALRTYEAMVTLDLSGRYENRKNLFTKAAVDLLVAGQVKVAADYMERGFLLDKSDAANFLEFGRAALQVGEKDLAALYFTRATKADPKDVDT